MNWKLVQNPKLKIKNSSFIEDESGFTLFEVIIVVAITAILAGITAAIVPTVGRGKELEIERDKIVSFLKFARQKSVSQEGGRQWGVRFSNSDSNAPFYVLFHSPPFSAGNVVERASLSARVRMTDPAAGNVKDIIFTKVTGTTTDASVTIALRNTGQQKTVSVSAQGVVTSD